MIEYVDRKIVNGALLRNNNGRYVSLHVNVEEEANRSAKVIKGKTTDDMEVKINLNESLNVATKGWIEVIGMPIGSDTIQCKEVCLILIQCRDCSIVSTCDEIITICCSLFIDYFIQPRR